MSVKSMGENRLGMNHQKYLDGSICNHLRGDGFGGLLCQEIFTPLVFCIRVKLCSYLHQVSVWQYCCGRCGVQPGGVG